MESDSGKRAKESGVRDRRYSIRYPFAAGAEMLELKSGNRVRGMTSDLSLGGCFVCARRTLEVRTRVRGTLTYRGQKVTMLAVVRVVKPQVGMGIEFLDIDPESNATLLAWIESLRNPHEVTPTKNRLLLSRAII
jgi:PilZ domain